MVDENLKEEIMQAIIQMKRVNASVVVDDLTHREFFTLDMLIRLKDKSSNNEGVYVSSLANKLKISMPQASRLLKTMEEKEYITRVIDKNDRRNTYVLVTELGIEKRNCAKIEMDDFVGRVIEHMGKENVRQMINLINRCSTVMKEEYELRKEKKHD